MFCKELSTEIGDKMKLIDYVLIGMVIGGLVGIGAELTSTNKQLKGIIEAIKEQNQIVRENIVLNE